MPMMWSIYNNVQILSTIITDKAFGGRRLNNYKEKEI